MRRSFRTLSIATTAVTLVLIGWGGLVRATGSGDGCPDWPRCFGRWIPRLEYHTLIEYVHRALAVTSGLLALALAIVGIALLVRRRRHGTDPGVPSTALWLAVALAPLFAVQGALGGWVVLSGLDPTVVTIHFAAAFAVLAIIVAITTLVVVTGGATARGGYARLASWTAVATYVLVLIGTHVRAEGAGLVFRDWPLMGGRLIPSFELRGAAEMALHRGLALVVAGLVIWLAVRARTMRPRVGALVTLSTVAAVAVLAQAILGGLNVVSELAVAPQAGHVAVAAILWAAVVALAVASHRVPAPDPWAEPDTADRAPVDPPIVRETIRAYVALTKPRIITLLLITTVPAMILAANGMPSLWLIAATLIGGAMAAGAANAINMYLDRDIDEVMRRTRQRPLPRHSIEPEHALRFGFWLGGAAFAFLALTVNLLAAVLALAALAFYVFVYTMWLKRSTDQNIVIGGAAGAVPVLVGWAAVTGSLAWPAWILFAVIFVWTPPHFWALAMKVRDDYALAGVPMMPVVRGEDETRRHIFLYALVLFATTLVLVPVAGMGPIYIAVAVIAGGLFVFRSLQLWRTPSDDRAWGLFKYSVVYLGALFGAVALDALVRSAT
jgi:protoheme IX farnesyltransferase